MYLSETKALAREAMRRAMEESSTAEKFRDLHISLEFPMQKHQYPSIWVDFNPVGSLEPAGIDHHELATVGTGTVRVRRWRFQGYASYTAVAMTSLERDELVDEMVRVFGAGTSHSGYVAYRSYVEDNPLIAVNIDFDQIEQRGFSSSPGTPWETDEILYEATLALEMVGEFTTDPSGALVRVDEINLLPYSDTESVPPWPAP